MTSRSRLPTRPVRPTAAGLQLITADLVPAGPELAPVDGAVLVDGDRIAWAGRQSDLSPPPARSDRAAAAITTGLR